MKGVERHDGDADNFDQLQNETSSRTLLGFLVEQHRRSHLCLCP